MSKSTCSIEGCYRESQARTWCKMHWKRWKTTGTTDARVHTPKPCSIDGCEKVSEKRDWCGMHYRRWLLQGSTGEAESRRLPPPPHCTVSQCDHKHYAKGMCGMHYQRLKLTGTTADPIRPEWPPKPDVCTVDNCGDTEVLARGFCTKHYLRWWKHGNTDDPPVQTECGNGHEWRPETTVVYSGKRYCKFCVADHDGRRRAQKAATQSEPVNFAVILAEFGMVCHICSGEIESRSDLHMDHVIPLAKGGTHTYDNIRPSHAGCNLRKAAKLPDAATGAGVASDAPDLGLAV